MPLFIYLSLRRFRLRSSFWLLWSSNFFCWGENWSSVFVFLAYKLCGFASRFGGRILWCQWPFEIWEMHITYIWDLDRICIYIERVDLDLHLRVNGFYRWLWCDDASSRSELPGGGWAGEEDGGLSQTFFLIFFFVFLRVIF